MADGKVTIEAKLDKSKFDSGLKGMEGGLGKFGSVAKGAFKAVAIAGAVAFGAVATSAVKAYAEYEQAVGGVETLFKNSSGVVMKYANEAYKTAGMSANQYMSTVTAFSASLLQSLGGDTQKAAEVGNQAVVDMSDNVNKMGSNMEDVKNAFQGFAKQNYQMLDNLKLGYGGTRSEMERLLKDATAISGVEYDINNLADVYTAIHIIQTELGITGTTAKEASTTISGSFQTMKSSWENLMIAFGSGEGIDAAMNNFMSSLGTFGENVLPVIGQAIMSIVTGIADGLEQNKEVLKEKFEGLLSAMLEALPGLSVALLKMVVILVEVLLEGLASLLGTICVKLLELGYNLLKWIVDGINSGIGWIGSQLSVLGSNIINFLKSSLMGVVSVGPRFIQWLWSGILSLVGWIVSAVGGVGSNILNALKNGIGDAFSVGANLVKGLWNGIASVKDWILGKIKGFGSAVLKSMKNIFKEHSPSKATYEMGYFLVKGLGNAIDNEGKIAVDSAMNLAKKMIDVNFALNPSVANGLVGSGVSQTSNSDNRTVNQYFYNKQTSPYEAYRKVAKAYAY